MPRSALTHKLATSQPLVANRDGSEIPLSFGSAPDAVESEYWALRREAGLMDLSHRGRIRVRGKDAARFLHGMVTNDVQGLRAGAGQYAFLLNVHGHILADAHIFRLDEQSFLLDCQTQSHDVIWQSLEHHIIMDDVELEDLRESLCLFAVEGPMARRALEDSVPEVRSAIAALSNRFDHVFVAAIETRILRASLSGEDGYWVLADLQHASEWLDSILAPGVTSRRAFAVKPVGFEALEVRRIEAGIPRYGIDITEKTLPQETGQMQALSFNKGCYIGQEVVERIRSQGHVNRKLMRLRIEGRHEIAPQTPIQSDGQTIGATASSAYCFGLEKTIAFGYLRREFAGTGTIASAAGVPAVVEELPAASVDESEPRSAQSAPHQ
jgi:folate-binding protein YgfZ